MRRRWILLFLIFALVAAWLFSREPPDSSPGFVERAPLPANIPRATPSLVVASRTVEADPPVHGDSSLEGEIFNGTPVQDAEVSIPALSRSVVSGEDGRFRFDDLPPGPYDVFARSGGLVACIEEVSGFETYDLEPAASALINVVDEQNQPVPNIEIVIESPCNNSTVTTDQTGAVRVEHLLGDEMVAYAIAPPGKVSTRPLEELEPASEREITIRLLSGPELEILVLDDLGMPVPKATVSLYNIADHALELEALSNEAGFALFASVPGAHYSVTVSSDRFGLIRKTIHTEPAAANTRVTLQYQRGLELRVKIVDVGGLPIEGAAVTLARSRRGFDEIAEREGKSDAQGELVFSGLVRGGYRLGAGGGEYARVEVSLDIRASEVQQIVLDRPARISGRVIGAAPGLSLIAVKAPRGLSKGLIGDHSLVDPIVATDQEGRFIFEELESSKFYSIAPLARHVPEDGEYREMKELDDWSVKNAVIARAGDEDVVLRLACAGELEVELLTGGSSPRDVTAKISGRTIEVRGTNFVVPELCPGSEALEVAAPGYKTIYEDVEIPEQGRVKIELEFQRSFVVTGRVISADEQLPIEGAEVELVGEETIVYTDRDGGFIFREVAEGEDNIRAAVAGFSEETVGPLKLSAKNRGPIIIRLKRGVTLAGRIHRGDDPISALITYFADGSNGDDGLYTTTNAVGKFRFSVPPGRGELSLKIVLDVGEIDRRVAVTVPKQGLENIDIDLAAGTSQIIVDVSAVERSWSSWIFLLPGLDAALPERQSMFYERAYTIHSFRDQVVFRDLEPGDYTVRLGALAKNVHVSRANETLHVRLEGEPYPGRPTRPPPVARETPRMRRASSDHNLQSFETATDRDREPQSMRVTGVQVSVDPQHSEAPCADGQLFTFTGAITTDGPGVVTFTFERSDGAYDSRGPRRMVFATAGTQHVTDTWRLHGRHEAPLSKKLRVYAPNEVLSEPAIFTIYCTP